MAFMGEAKTTIPTSMKMLTIFVVTRLYDVGRGALRCVYTCIYIYIYIVCLYVCMYICVCMSVCMYISSSHQLITLLYGRLSFFYISSSLLHLLPSFMSFSLSLFSLSLFLSLIHICSCTFLKGGLEREEPVFY